MQHHNHIIQPDDNDIVRDIKSQVNDPQMQDSEYWIENEDEILSVNPVHEDETLVGVELVFGV